MRKIVLLALGLLAACSRPAGQKPDAAQAPVSATSRSIAASETGIGPITAQTPFDAAALQALFPGAHVEPSVMMDGDRKYPILTVMGADLGMILEVDGDQSAGIAAIEALGGDVRGPGNETLMNPWNALGFTLEQCRSGDHRDLGALVCHRPGAPRLAYLIGVRSWSGPGAPSAAKLAADGFLRGLRWTRS